jgi:hypothetical protein
MIPRVPRVVSGINYDFRFEAVSACQIGTVTLATFNEISLGNRLDGLQAEIHTLSECAAAGSNQGRLTTRGY